MEQNGRKENEGGGSLQNKRREMEVVGSPQNFRNGDENGGSPQNCRNDNNDGGSPQTSFKDMEEVEDDTDCIRKISSEGETSDAFVPGRKQKPISKQTVSHVMIIL